MGNYLYNGVELPALPVVDGCQYMYIFPVTNSYYCHITAKARHYLKNGVICRLEDTMGCCYSAKSGGTEWGVIGGGLGTMVASNNATISAPIWSNHDIYNEDGTLYLAASEPVPPLNHAALMQGFATMLSLRK